VRRLRVLRGARVLQHARLRAASLRIHRGGGTMRLRRAAAPLRGLRTRAPPEPTTEARRLRALRCARVLQRAQRRAASLRVRCWRRQRAAAPAAARAPSTRCARDACARD
jgi:hypothetical protein